MPTVDAQSLPFMKSRRKFDEAVAQHQIGYKNGIPIEKGVTLNERFLERNKTDIEKTLQFYTAYPDRFIDEATPESDGFQLFFYQRIVLRAFMRYKNVYIVAPRAFSKSFLTILALMLQCIFIPNHKAFICAPQINQACKIATEKITEIYQHWPLIRREVIGGDIEEMPGNFSKDNIRIKFRNGSVLDVKKPTASLLMKITRKNSYNCWDI